MPPDHLQQRLFALLQISPLFHIIAAKMAAARLSRFHTRVGRRFSLSSITPIVDFSLFDHGKPVGTLSDINNCNHQRFEISQLDGILFEELSTNRCVGYKDTSTADFWVRGHMPGFALMPGVVMCEAAAQLSSYFTVKHDLLGCDVVGLGGIENCRFRGSVLPGQRLTMMVRGTKLRRGGMIACEFQGWVDQRIVVTGELKGVPLFEASRILGRAKA